MLLYFFIYASDSDRSYAEDVFFLAGFADLECLVSSEPFYRKHFLANIHLTSTASISGGSHIDATRIFRGMEMSKSVLAYQWRHSKTSDGNLPQLHFVRKLMVTYSF